MTRITTPEISVNQRLKEDHAGALRERALKQDPPTKPACVETQFTELADGTLIELMEHPADANRTLLAVCKGGKVEYLDHFNDGDRVLVPFSSTNEALKPIRLPKGVSPYASVQALLKALEDLVSRCIGIDPRYIPVLADFILSTWFVDRVSVAPYLSVIGLPQSGKTTLLKLLSLLCRRSLLIGDITSASLYTACTQFMATILVDEAGTFRGNRQLRHILRTGTTRDVLSLRGNHPFHAYGAKVLSWLEPPDDPALNSRCILILMSETTRTDLSKVDNPEVEQSTMALKAQLLQFRLENYGKVRSAPLKGDDKLRPRSRDLLWALSAANLQDPERSQSLLKFFRSVYAVPLEPLSTEQNAVLLTLFSFIHRRENTSSVLTSDLTGNVNQCLKLSGERLRLQPRKVGAVLTSLGFFNRTRGNSGWCVYLNRGDIERIHKLAVDYGIDKTSERLVLISLEKCTLCQAAGKNKNGDTKFVSPISEHPPLSISVKK